MGVFEDKRYEELDWISRAVEPIDSALNSILADIPNEIEIDFATYSSLIEGRFSLNIDIGDIIMTFIRDKELSWDEERFIIGCFEFKAESENLILDFVNQKLIGGPIKLIKITQSLDDKILENLLGSRAIHAIYATNISDNEKSNKRINDVLEIIGPHNNEWCIYGLKARSSKKKLIFLQRRIKDFFKKNEWKIKDSGLASRFGTWIKLYIESGNIAAWTNICKLKVMSHSGNAIYSMKEEEV